MKTILVILGLVIAVNTFAQQNKSYDRYGGCIDIPIDEGNGFFRLGEKNGKHFLITPEGNAFRAIGLNHSHTLTSNDFDAIIADMKDMGFNSGDYQGPAWQWERIPYTKGIQLLEISGWLPESQFGFRDVFDPDYLAFLENKIKNTVQPQANNDMLICYFLTDVPVWEITKYGKSWISFYKSLDGNSAGGMKWIEWKEENPKENELEFIRVIARHLYSKTSGFIRKYDANHLIFTDRYIEYHFPESALEEALPFVDGIAIQPKNFLNISFYENVYRKYQKPIFIADHVTSHITEEYSNTMGQVANNSADYLEYYRWSVHSILSLPFVVGYNKCQYQDEVNGTQLKQGLYRENGEPYEYVSGLKMAHKRALDTAYTVPPPDLARGLKNWGAYEEVKKEAVQRIDKYRKGDAHLKIYLPELDSAANTWVNVKLKRHDFKWGAVVKESFISSPFSKKYKEIFLKYFNATGFAVACKPKFRDTSREENMVNNAMPWFLKNDVYVRGHTLAWEGFNYLRPEDKAIYENTKLTDQEKGDSLLASMGKHFPHAIPKWDVRCWDVSNEPIANNLVNDLLPEINTHVHWFKLADSIRSVYAKQHVLLYQNDYQIISAIMPWALTFKKEGYAAVGRPSLYREILDEQIALGAPVEGIGFQSRLKGGLLTPDSIYKRLCDFDRFNLPYQATEFEIRNGANNYTYTAEERRMLTEYMMVMYFSHPKVNGFWHWTFADGRSTENLDYPLFNFDGSPKVNGQVWMDLMNGFFASDEVIKTDSLGALDIRGYFGRYDLIAEVGDEVLIGTFNMDSADTDLTQRVYLDKGLSLNGLEDGAAYDLDQPIDIDIYAFSNYGDISSISLFLDFDSIGGAADSALALTYTPATTVEGWHELTVKMVDESGRHFSYSIDVYFGNKLPLVEILSMPDDTVYTTSTGNNISFNVTENYRPVTSVSVNYAGSEMVFRDTSGTFFFDLDPIEEGFSEFIIKVIDDGGGEVFDTVSFFALDSVNLLPFIDITSPGDSAVLPYGSEDLLTIEAADSDGSIEYVKVFLNDALTFTLYHSPYSIGLNQLGIGDYFMLAEARDNRGGTASTSVFFSIVDISASSIPAIHSVAFEIYPNPVTNTLHLSHSCNYALFTITGRRLLEGRETEVVDVSKLEDGMYLLKTNHGIHKVIKKS